VNKSTSASRPGGPLSLQSNLSSPQATAAMQKLVAAFNKTGKGTVNLNTTASETFRTLLPTYLSSANPPDLYTWYAGAVARDYASKGLLLDVSDVWKTMGTYSDALRKLSTDDRGQQIFIPTDYYWWGFFYRKSAFASWGVQPPKTWDDFIALCKTLKSKGVPPIGMSLGDNPWVASAWFDYLDIRINGAQFHRDLLAGKQSFADPKVKAVFTKWSEALPYFDPKGKGLSFQDASTKLYQKGTGMYLIGTFFADAAPKSMIDDMDFFQFPIIDPSMPVVEEAPTDGFFASARTGNPKGVKDFLTYLATPQAQTIYITSSSGTTLAANPDVSVSQTPMVRKGKAMLAAAADLTQFFNRDSSDALQPTADAALAHFIDQPQQIDSILATWQAAADKVRKG
jgi:multiple sugar transport system substrate-binding protein